ncbi:MAG: hypothetical protein QOJ61_2141, partial [Mycobacterium sp.]|nr:hypothetical protein [Mycobacterium sp.]
MTTGTDCDADVALGKPVSLANQFLPAANLAAI